jgi:hypothetical protein
MALEGLPASPLELPHCLAVVDPGVEGDGGSIGGHQRRGAIGGLGRVANFVLVRLDLLFPRRLPLRGLGPPL